jgi:hypothetical protein
MGEAEGFKHHHNQDQMRIAVSTPDLPTAKKKARELEVTWDTRENALQEKSPDLWGTNR